MEDKVPQKLKPFVYESMNFLFSVMREMCSMHFSDVDSALGLMFDAFRGRRFGPSEYAPASGRPTSIHWRYLLPRNAL